MYLVRQCRWCMLQCFPVSLQSFGKVPLGRQVVPSQAQLHVLWALK